MDKLIEHNENLDTPLYLPSHLESPKEKHDYFEVSDLETNIPQSSLLVTNKIYYNLNNFNTDSFKTSYLMKIQYHTIFSDFLLKFLRFNYQLIWQQDQSAYINFPQVLPETELLLFINSNTNRHAQYKILPH